MKVLGTQRVHANQRALIPSALILVAAVVATTSTGCEIISELQQQRATNQLESPTPGTSSAASTSPPSPVVPPTTQAEPIQAVPTVTPPSAHARLEDERNTIDIFRAAAPATVFVSQSRVVRNLYTGAAEVPSGAGTGFVWDKRGHIVTNYHVVDTSDRVKTTYNVTLYSQKSYDATLVGGEPNKDIAVLKITAPPEELMPLSVLQPTNKLEVGQKTIAIGNPFGLDHTLTTGVISALGREVTGYGGVTIRDMIQTDASINPGNSGGPLLDSAGQLIGVNTMIYSRSGASAGIGFAVPVSTVRRIVPQIIEFGKAKRAGLGVRLIDDRYAARAGVKGVIVGEVLANSPAATAGMRGLRRSPTGSLIIGDVIVGIDHHVVKDYDDLYNALDRYEEGNKVVVKVLRDGNVIELSLVLADMG